jgi:YVTN family beta-propeller protein
MHRGANKKRAALFRSWRRVRAGEHPERIAAMNSLIIPLLAIVATVLSLSAPPACQSGGLPLRQIADVPLNGGPSRLDYQTLDSATGRLYIAHLGADLMTVVDVNTLKVVVDVPDLKRVHGVLAVPALHRVYATATGTNELVVIDDRSLQVLTRVPAGDYPDGIAYASKEKKLYVSDLHGKTDTVVDAMTNRRIATIPLGGGAGNTQYDAVADRVYVTVHTRNRLAEIDPTTDKVVAEYPLPGCDECHGLLVDGEHGLAFIAAEGNARLGVFDLKAKKLLDVIPIGADPDVLAFDRSFGRLYISAESGIISVFDEHDRTVTKVGEGFFAPHAHTVSVDERTHRVYFPLQDVGGKPVLRIAVPTDTSLPAVAAR